MSAIDRQPRAQAAVAMLESNRTEAKALLGARSTTTSIGGVDSFPRSKTFRWLLGHPVGRWVGSAVITGLLARFPVGRLVGTWLLAGKTWRVNDLHQYQYEGTLPAKDIL